MNDFHDPELERLFGRNSGPTPDVDVAYQRVQGRVRQVKRRRAVVVSSAACSVLFAAAVFAGARTNSSNTVQPGGTATGIDGSPLTVSDSSDLSLPSSTVGDTMLESTDPGVTTPGTGSTATSVGNGGTTVTSPTGSNVSTPSTAPGATSGSVPSSSVTPSSSPATTSPATNPPTPITETFSGVGGSITVRLQNGSLTLVSYNAAAGFTADVQKASGSRVEVRFESIDQRTDIRVDIVGNGMSAQVDES